MLSEGGGVVDPQAEHGPDSQGAEPQVRVEPPPRSFTRWLEELSHKWGAEHLKTLAQRKGRLSDTMGIVPENMHRMANQTRLVLELIDDFRDGTYREISWRAVALLVGGLLYTVSPADVVPDVLPFLGKLDDLAVLTLVTRLVNQDLRNYCAFKGYDVDEYFRQKS
jgi:uncharacterized membrane protein YkvA (DUF1232 family)